MADPKNQVLKKLMGIKQIGNEQKPLIIEKLLEKPDFIDCAFEIINDDDGFSKFLQGMLPQGNYETCLLQKNISFTFQLVFLLFSCFLKSHFET
jgi:hypothetical protein